MQGLEPSDPRRLGRFTLRARMGSSGTTVAYLAGDGYQDVAVTTVAPHRVAEVELVSRLRREVDTARRVVGLYTLHVLGGASDGPVPYLVTEYVVAPSLTDHVNATGPLPADGLRALAVGTAEGLAALHVAGVVHGSFRPGSVLLASDGPRVVGFGGENLLAGGRYSPSMPASMPASMPPSTSQPTSQPRIDEGAGFASPEQASGQAATSASDVFSWGATVAFAATGRQPFAAASANRPSAGAQPGEAETAQLGDESLDLGGVDDDLARVVRAALNPDPALRPPAVDLLRGLLGVAELGPAALTSLVAQAWPSLRLLPPAQLPAAQLPTAQLPPAASSGSPASSSSPSSSLSPAAQWVAPASGQPATSGYPASPYAPPHVTTSPYQASPYGGQNYGAQNYGAQNDNYGAHHYGVSPSQGPSHGPGGQAPKPSNSRTTMVVLAAVVAVVVVVGAGFGVVALVGGDDGDKLSAAATVTPSATPRPTPTPTRRPTPTRTPAPTATPQASPTPVAVDPSLLGVDPVDIASELVGTWDGTVRYPQITTPHNTLRIELTSGSVGDVVGRTDYPSDCDGALTLLVGGSNARAYEQVPADLSGCVDSELVFSLGADDVLSVEIYLDGDGDGDFETVALLGTLNRVS